MDTTDVAYHTLKHGGFTGASFDGTVREVQESSEHHAWVVGVQGVTVVTTLEHRETWEVRAAVWSVVKQLDNGETFGAWIDGDLLYVETVSVTDRATAERIGRERGEIAIYNIVTEETVQL